MMRRQFAILLLPSLATTPALAEQAPNDDGSPRGLAAIGPGLVPEFDGAEDLRIVPFALADIHWGAISFEFRGLRGRVNLTPDSRWSVGPAAGVRLAREDADGPVGLLPEIDMAIEAGAHVGYRIGGNEYGEGSVQLELSAVHDVSGTHDGLLVTAAMSHATIRRQKFFASIDAQATWVNQDYARTYFGISDAESRAAGLDVHRPGSGLRDVGVGLNVGYWFSSKFGAIGRAGVSYLLDDVSDSPIVKEGSRRQPAAGIAIAYRF